LPNVNTDYAAQVLNGTIYVSNTGDLGKYNETKTQLDKTFKSFLPNQAWSEIQNGKRFLKADNFLLVKIGNEYQVLNEKSGLSRKNRCIK